MSESTGGFIDRLIGTVLWGVGAGLIGGSFGWPVAAIIGLTLFGVVLVVLLVAAGGRGE